MNKFFCVFCILLFILKTENVFSNNLIYDVNNIEVKGKTNNSLANKKLIELAFKKAFTVFIDKTLLREDAISLYKTKSKIIKDLILTYQIINNDKNDNLSIFNIKFDPKKINKFLARRGISYADISNISITLLPVLIKNKEIFLYEENFFYKNWIKPQKELKNKEDELISYTLALENIEDLEYINNTKENINLLDVKKINSFKGDLNYALIIVYFTEDKFKAFLKTSIKGTDIDRNIDLNFSQKNKNKTQTYEEAIIILKKEINQIWKEQNLVDVNTPSFLDFFLEINKVDDYLKLKSALDAIDVIESYSVLEMTNKYSKIRIKYRGKISKIKDKFSTQKINIRIVNNVWKIRIN